jgi:replicative DNA helicase Mcm
LAAANPKYGRFDQYSDLASQISFPPTLLTRFDLIFPFKDFSDPEKDAAVIDRILAVHRGEIHTEISNDLFRKYVAYAKSHYTPKLTREAEDTLREFYLSLRNPDRVDMSSFVSGRMVPNKERIQKAVPIGTRQAEALIRLAEAHARMRLSKEVLRKDALAAIELVTESLKMIGFDPETGSIDVDRFEGRTSSSLRSKIDVVMQAFVKLEKELGTSEIPFADISRECSAQGIDDSELYNILSRLKNGGDIFEPHPDKYKRLI